MGAVDFGLQSADLLHPSDAHDFPEGVRHGRLVAAVRQAAVLHDGVRRGGRVELPQDERIVKVSGEVARESAVPGLWMWADEKRAIPCLFVIAWPFRFHPAQFYVPYV